MMLRYDVVITYLDGSQITFDNVKHDSDIPKALLQGNMCLQQRSLDNLKAMNRIIVPLANVRVVTMSVREEDTHV